MGGHQYASLALLSSVSLYAVFVGIFCCYTCSEFSIIASISLFSSPFIERSRGTMISVFVGSLSAGRMVGALTLQSAYANLGYAGCTLIASATMMTSIILFALVTTACCQHSDANAQVDE